jgi:uncharacterized RDD family membrane protein YckC
VPATPATPGAHVTAQPRGARLPERHLEVASTITQLGAALVDGVGAAVVVAAFTRALLALQSIKPSVQGVVDALHADAPSLLPLLLAIPLGVGLWQLTSLLLKATPGQRMFRLRLVDATGGTPVVPRLVLRAVVNALGVLALLAGPAFALLIDARRRGPGDVVAGTVAVTAASIAGRGA